MRQAKGVGKNVKYCYKMHNLSKNKDLVTIRPDKGNGAVLPNRSEYVSKVETIVNDASKFVILDSAPLELCQERENRLIRFLRDSLLSYPSRCLS